MMHKEIQDRLDDYVDGLLPEEERQAVETHLEACEECRREVAGLRSLLADVSALPRNVQPGRDLWPDVAARTVGGKVERDSGHRVWLVRGAMAAAAVALIAVSSLITAFWMRGRPARPIVTVAPVDTIGGHPDAVLVEVRAFDRAYGQAIAELCRTLQTRRDQLAPETALAIEENLHAIDRAIRDAQVALAADPGEQKPVHTILAMYRRKIDLLQRAVRLPKGS